MFEDGTLCWGSNYYESRADKLWEYEGVNNTLGAALESGLDNSPMYDNIPFNKEKNMMCLSDVGLTGLYINDCNCLIFLADVIGKNKEGEILKSRCKKATQGLMSLWNEDFGMFLNKRTDTKEFSYRISPTNFYALFCNDVTNKQIEKIMNDHFYNEQEFWGEYIIPSIARNDKAYPDQDYWRGRIWAPMNYLVYKAFKNHNLIKACRDIADKSKNLLMKEWKMHGHVHENYNGDTGLGCDVKNSDKFYHWGGLLGYIVIDAENLKY